MGSRLDLGRGVRQLYGVDFRHEHRLVGIEAIAAAHISETAQELGARVLIRAGETVVAEDAVGLVDAVVSIGTGAGAGPRFAVIVEQCVSLLHALAAPGADRVLDEHIGVVIRQGVGHLRPNHMGAFPPAPGAANGRMVAVIGRLENFPSNAPTGDVFQ